MKFGLLGPVVSEVKIIVKDNDNYDNDDKKHADHKSSPMSP